MFSFRVDRKKISVVDVVVEQIKTEYFLGDNHGMLVGSVLKVLVFSSSTELPSSVEFSQVLVRNSHCNLGCLFDGSLKINFNRSKSHS